MKPSAKLLRTGSRTSKATNKISVKLRTYIRTIKAKLRVSNLRSPGIYMYNSLYCLIICYIFTGKSKQTKISKVHATLQTPPPLKI